MWTTPRPAIRRGPRRILSTLAALTLAFAGPSLAQAAPPIAASLSAAIVGQAEGSYGTIKGRLVWGGAEIPKVKVLEEKGKAEKDPNVCAKDRPILSRELIVDPETKGVSYAFAYLSRPKGSNPEAIKQLLKEKPALEIDQTNCEFLPYLTPMYKDQALTVKASDPGINHNVRLIAFTNQGLNQNVASGSELKLNLVPESRPITLKCDIHPWMRSYVMVFDHPFFATTGKDGSFEIRGVPEGTQNLVIWQENVGYANKGFGRGMPVSVKAGAVTDVGEIILDPTRVKPAG